MPDYRVEVYRYATSTDRDFVEHVADVSTDDWQWCLTLIRVYTMAFPEHIVAACNTALAEPDTDGLSDEERDEMLEVVDQARAVIATTVDAKLRRRA